MKSCRLNINAFFCAALCALILTLCGCQTTEEKKAAKEKTLISLHLETNPDGTPRTSRVPVYRLRPEMITVMKEPFLANQNILKASVVDLEGGFGIYLQFDDHGTRILEMYTGRFRGKRIAVNSAFPELRCLAAPRITSTIKNGSFIFTPDATRDETERIVRGINNAAKDARKNNLL
jgi:preprotein translocase subunit SecD